MTSKIRAYYDMFIVAKLKVIKYQKKKRKERPERKNCYMTDNAELINEILKEKSWPKIVEVETSEIVYHHPSGTFTKLT